MKDMPSDRRALVAVDLGAESCRVSLLRWKDEDPHVLLVHRFANAPVDQGDTLRWEIGRIEEEVHAGIRRCAEIASEGIRSIAVDGWGVDYVRLDEHGKAASNPFCYRDVRTRAAWDAIHQRISRERLRELTGIQLMPINTLYQLYADGADTSAKPWLNLPEYILHRLGGRRTAEYTNATHTELIDAQTKEWSKEIFAATGLRPDTAAPIVPPGSDLGELRGPLAELPALRGARLIAPACHDTASAIAGIPDANGDWAYISSGTWSLVGTLLDSPVNTDLARKENFTNLGAAGGRICFHKNVNGMWMIRQCIESWAETRAWTVAELIAEAEKLPAPDALLDVDDAELLLPHEMPTRMNAQRARRGLKPLNTLAGNAPEFANLIFHSLAARYADVLRDVTEITGKTFRRIYIVGGGSRNALLNRLTESATGIEVRCGSAESSTLGNFAIQLASLEGGASAEEVAKWAGVLADAVL